MAAAAVALLESLDPDQRSLASWPFDDHEERTRWFYTPTDHGGLSIGAMRAAQQRSPTSWWRRVCRGRDTSPWPP